MKKVLLLFSYGGDYYYIIYHRSYLCVRPIYKYDASILPLAK
jgi:hypothetical protein